MAKSIEQILRGYFNGPKDRKSDAKPGTEDQTRDWKVTGKKFMTGSESLVAELKTRKALLLNRIDERTKERKLEWDTQILPRLEMAPKDYPWRKKVTADEQDSFAWRCIREKSDHQAHLTFKAMIQAFDMFVGPKCSRIVEAYENRDRQVFADFDDLYDYIAGTIGKIDGIGTLTVYDTAKRFGHCLNHPLRPERFIYLNCGAFRGANNVLKGRMKVRNKMDASIFQELFGDVPVIFLENILCHYEDEFPENIQPSGPEIKKLVEDLRRNGKFDIEAIEDTLQPVGRMIEALDRRAILFPNKRIDY